MSNPVVIDDGGSTRIKHLKQNTNMDGLMGVLAGGATVYRDVAAEPFQTNGGNFKCHLRVRYHQEDGDQQIKPQPVGGGNAGKDLDPTDTVFIRSRNGQLATITFNAANQLVVTLSASAAGIDPIVEARQDGGIRRYIVSNAGRIDRVDWQPAVGAPEKLFDANDDTTIYTMVHFR
jgi:hypothetical protein